MIDVNVTTITGESVNTLGTYYPVVETLSGTTTVSTPPAGLVFHSRLDNIVEEKILDSSGNSYDGTVNGSPQVVPDDSFGTCLCFDSESQYIDLPTDSLPTGNEITVSFWAWGSDSIPKYNSILFATQSGNRVLNVHLGWTDNKVYFDCGCVSTLFDRISKTASLEKLKGCWRHWVFTKNAADGTMKIYLDGELWHSGSSLTRSLPAADTFRFGGSDSTDKTYMGKVSNLRIYDRELSRDEIKYDIAGDITSMARFRMAHPLDFRLTDDNDRHVLYIDDSGQSHNLNFEIVNTSGEAVTIAAGSGAAASDNYHFELKFRPATLSNAAITELQAASSAGADWNMAYVHNTNGTDSLYFLSTAPQTLNSGDKLKITLSGISAEPGKGARGTRVETRYNNITYRGESLSGYLEEHISVINHSGKQYLPLHTGFHLGNRVLNVNGAANTLLLRLTNTLKPDAAYPDRSKITLTGPGAAAPSKLILSFDAQADGESKDWALGTTSQVAAITVKVKKEDSTGALVEDTEWTVNKTTTGNNTQWDITHDSGKTIDPGTHITIELSTMTTALPAGLTNLYLHYENIPGYWDGQSVCPIEKSPLILKDGLVGIGTTTPNTNLSVVGRVRGANHSNETEYTEIGHGGSHGYINTVGDGRLDFRHDDTTKMSLTTSGELGIGTTSPAEKLEVRGNVKFGNSYKSLHFKNHPTWSDPMIYSPEEGNLRISANQGIGFWTNNEVEIDFDPQMYIDSGGKVGIGTSSPFKNLHIARNGFSQPGIRIDGDGKHWDIIVEANDTNDQDLLFVYNDGLETNNNASFWIEPKGGHGEYSDLNLKDNIKPIESTLKKVLQLKPITYTWKNDKKAKSQMGFGAQDVAKVFPELVTDKRGGKSLKYKDFSVLAIAAIQEQQKKIDQLETKLADLTQKVQTLLG